MKLYNYMIQNIWVERQNFTFQWNGYCEGFEYVANCVVFALVFILDLLLRLIYVVEPRNLMSMKRFHSLLYSQFSKSLLVFCFCSLLVNEAFSYSQPQLRTMDLFLVLLTYDYFHVWEGWGNSLIWVPHPKLVWFLKNCRFG